MYSLNFTAFSWYNSQSMVIRPCSHNNCGIMYGLKYIYLRKAKILRLENTIKIISTIWTNTAVFCDVSQIIERITLKKVGIISVGLYLRTLYKLYLHYYTKHAACSMVIGPNSDIRTLCQWILRHLILRIDIKGQLYTTSFIAISFF